MTTFFGDWSNHDWGRGPMDFAAMARDGIVGGTHKSSDGLNFYRDPYWAGAISRMRATFTNGAYGPYHVLWGNRSIRSQIDWWFTILDATAPGWRTDPRFIVMTDNEPFGYNQAPSIAQVNEAGDYIRSQVGKTMLAYCPPWHYGGALAGLRYPLVSSNYGSNPAGAFRSIYPGDSSGRWTSAAAPVVALQYGSRAVMGGQHTTDANAFRGTVDDLIRTFSPDSTTGDLMALTTDQLMELLRNAHNSDWMASAIMAGGDRVLPQMGGKETFPVVNVLHNKLDGLTAALAKLLAVQGVEQAKIEELLARPTAQITITPETVQPLADALGQILVAHPGNPLGDADKPAIQEALGDFFREHLGGGQPASGESTTTPDQQS